jgi:hypothetical protein
LNIPCSAHAGAARQTCDDQRSEHMALALHPRDNAAMSCPSPGPRRRPLPAPRDASRLRRAAHLRVEKPLQIMFQDRQVAGPCAITPLPVASATPIAVWESCSRDVAAMPGCTAVLLCLTSPGSGNSCEVGPAPMQPPSLQPRTPRCRPTSACDRLAARRPWSPWASSRPGPGSSRLGKGTAQRRLRCHMSPASTPLSCQHALCARLP